MQDTVDRLFSMDANDRVKAAAELGEIGTPTEAPILLKVAYEDEASTVRQMAIQAYAEILSVSGIDEIIKAATSHFDEYVKIYAITVLGNMNHENTIPTLIKLLSSKDEKELATTLRALIHANATKAAPDVLNVLQQNASTIVVRNCIEALTLWKHKTALDYISKRFYQNIDDLDLEIKTITSFFMGVMGDKTAIKYIENNKIDDFVRLKISGTTYRGKKGILSAIDLLR